MYAERSGEANMATLATRPHAAFFQDRVFSDGRDSRRYKLFVPSSDPTLLHPLVVMLHGAGQTADDFAAGTRMNDIAAESGVIIAYPEQPWSANMARSWNWYNEENQFRDAGEPALIAGITRRIIEDFPVDKDRIYVAGLSSGGAAAAVMALAYPDIYAAVCVHSGLAVGAARGTLSAFSAMRDGGTRRTESTGQPIPTIVFHGDEDSVVNHANADQVVIQAVAKRDLHIVAGEGRSIGGVGYTRTVRSDAEGRALVEQWVLHGTGHAWSGGSKNGSRTEPLGPDASKEMMRFFLDHSRGS